MLLTGFAQVEFLLEQVGHQPKKSYESTECCADDIEVNDIESRHDEPGVQIMASTITTRYA